VVRLEVRLLDEYLEFLSGRCRPNTVLAVAYDLKVFFTVVARPPRRVRSVDVLEFMTVQRAGGNGRLQVAETGRAGVTGRTLRRRLSSVSGFYGFLLARGDVSVNPVPRGLPTRRERQRPGRPRHRPPLLAIAIAAALVVYLVFRSKHVQPDQTRPKLQGKVVAVFSNTHYAHEVNGQVRFNITAGTCGAEKVSH
jgi:hypothetical protein